MDTKDDWETYLESDVPIVLQTGADWCGPCKMLMPMLQAVSKDYEGKVQYVYMDVDKFPDVAQMLEISHIPKTFLIYKGDLVDSFGGVPQDSSKLHDFFKKAQRFADGSDEGHVEESGNQGQKQEEKPKEQAAQKSGIDIEILTKGDGPVVPRGSIVKVHYTGKLPNG